MEVSPPIAVFFAFCFLCHIFVFSFLCLLKISQNCFFLVNLHILPFIGVCWTRKRLEAKLFLDRKMIVEIKAIYVTEFAFLIISCANDGESSQNCSSSNRFSFVPHICFTRSHFLTDLFCVGMKNWVKELVASDVIGVQRREKVSNILEIQEVSTTQILLMIVSSSNRGNWFVSGMCIKLRQIEIACINQKRFHSWDVTRATDVVRMIGHRQQGMIKR